MIPHNQSGLNIIYGSLIMTKDRLARREPSADPGALLGGVRLERGAEPLHLQVYGMLRARLDAGEWAPGQQLPVERDLATAFGCSLITVRRAMDELVRERRIVRRRGSGTFACEPPVDRDLAALTSFTDEMNDRGLSTHTTVVSAALVEASPAAAEHLELPAGTAVYRIERVRYLSGQPLLLEEVHLPAQLFPGLLDCDLERGSLYEWLAARYGLVITRGRETVEPALPSSREARLLDQSRREPVLLLELVSLTADGTPVEYCRSVVRGDRARYHLDVRRLPPHPLGDGSSPSLRIAGPSPAEVDAPRTSHPRRGE